MLNLNLSKTNLLNGISHVPLILLRALRHLAYCTLGAIESIIHKQFHADYKNYCALRCYFVLCIIIIVFTIILE